MKTSGGITSFKLDLPPSLRLKSLKEEKERKKERKKRNAKNEQNVAADAVGITAHTSFPTH